MQREKKSSDRSNKVILLGRLGADPQLRYTPSGRANASFNMATNASWKDQDGNQQERTDWHRITAWGKIAEVMGEWLKKGSYVYIEGRIQTRSYEDDNGVKKYITGVVATDMEMLGRRDEGGGKTDVPEQETPPAEPEDDLPF